MSRLDIGEDLYPKVKGKTDLASPDRRCGGRRIVRLGSEDERGPFPEPAVIPTPKAAE